MEKSEDTVHEEVKEYYGSTLQDKGDLKTNACCIGELSKFTSKEKKILSQIHPEVIKKFYGCGSPLPKGIEGATVLDLGCGTGKDCFVASALVGENGKVIGVDMTKEQISVANSYIEYHTKAFGLSKPNVEFHNGVIEDLAPIGIQSNSIDCIISNCVINLASNKEKVFREIWRCLKYGGELYFSDVYASRRIPEHLKNDKVLWGECLSGALYFEDFRRILAKVGFNYYYIVSMSEISVGNTEIEKQLGPIKFHSITVKAYKIPELEDKCEDYQEEAEYLGTLGEGLENEFNYDSTHKFIKGNKIKICRNLALVLTKCILYQKHFLVSDPKDHLGLFDCSGSSCDCSNTGCC